MESASSFKVDEAPSEQKAHLLVTSAHTEASLKQRVSDIQEYAEHNQKRIQDLAFTLGVKRDHQPHRAFMIANDDGTLEEPVLSKPVAISSVVFAFTGQGTQWPGMARELLTSVDSFRADIKNMDRILQRLPDPPVWSIEGIPSLPAALSDSNGANISQMSSSIPAFRRPSARPNCHRLFARLFKSHW